MTVYTKVDGLWVTVTDAYRKVSGVWDQSENIYRKNGSAWAIVHTKPGPPLSAPVLSATVQTGTNPTTGTNYRYILVGNRYPSGGSAQEPRVKLIRVLTGGLGAVMPTTPFDAVSNVSASDADWPYESWSDFYYNVAPPGAPSDQYRADTAILWYKAYLPNYDTTGQRLPAGDYNFAAWTLDNANQWSTSNSTVTLNVSSSTTDQIVKSAVIRPLASGTLSSATTTYADGDLVIRSNTGGTSTHGAYFYSFRIQNPVGESGTPTITSAKIRLTRANTGGVGGAADVWLYRHTYSSGGVWVPNADRLEIENVGTLALGQTKNFNLPTSWYNNMDTGVNGIGVYYQEPAGTSNAANMNVLGIDNDYRSGEVLLDWVETP